MALSCGYDCGRRKDDRNGDFEKYRRDGGKRDRSGICGSMPPDTPNAQLKGLKKVFLHPGEEVRVEIVLDDHAFALCDEDGRNMLEAGEYTVFAGTRGP